MIEISKFIENFKNIKDCFTLKSFEDVLSIFYRSKDIENVSIITKLELLKCLDSKELSEKCLNKIRKYLKRILPSCFKAKIEFEKICNKEDAFIVDRIKDIKIYQTSQSLQSNIKSGFLVLFLKKLMSKEIDKTLYESLDFNSLVRLSLVSGGKTIAIPTYDRVEGLLASAYYSYLVIIERMDKHNAYGQVKKELGIEVDKQVISEDLSKICLIFSKEVNTINSDISNMFDNILKLIKTFQVKLDKSLDKIEDNEQLLKLYNDMNISFLTLTRALSQGVK